MQPLKSHSVCLYNCDYCRFVCSNSHKNTCITLSSMYHTASHFRVYIVLCHAEYLVYFAVTFKLLTEQFICGLPGSPQYIVSCLYSCGHCIVEYMPILTWTYRSNIYYISLRHLILLNWFWIVINLLLLLLQIIIHSYVFHACGFVLVGLWKW